MTTTADSPTAATPWHFWVVAIVAVLWNGFGGYDYTMSHLQGEAYFRQMGMTDAQIALMDVYPTWMHAVWAIGVWGSVLGTILLIGRQRWALHAFVLSAVGALGNVVYTAATPAVSQEMGVAMPLAILAICLVFAWYSWLMAKRGVLR